MTKTIIALLLSFSAAPAIAEPVTVTSTVQTADLNLSSKAGQQALDRRLLRAVNEVCGEASSADLSGKNDVRRCRVQTLAGLEEERSQRIAQASGQPIEVAAR